MVEKVDENSGEYVTKALGRAPQATIGMPQKTFGLLCRPVVRGFTYTGTSRRHVRRARRAAKDENMAKTREYMDYLDEVVGIAPANSQEEYQAADTIAGIMMDHGLDPVIEEFDAHPLGTLMVPMLSIVLFVLVLVAGLTEGTVHVVLLLLAAVVVGLVLFNHFGFSLFEGLGPTSQSQNVVALHAAEGDQVVKGARPIVIVAHYDTPRQSVLRKGALAQMQSPLRRATIPCAIAVAVSVVFQILLFLPDVVRSFMWVVGLIALVPMVLLALCEVIDRFLPCTAGANDNKSSVSALLALMDKVCPGEDRVTGNANEDRPTRRRSTDPPVAAPVPRMIQVVEEVKGVRHGADVMRSLGILPPSCELMYEEPKVRVIEEVPEGGEAALGEPSSDEPRGTEGPALDADEQAQGEPDLEPVAAAEVTGGRKSARGSRFGGARKGAERYAEREHARQSFHEDEAEDGDEGLDDVELVGVDDEAFADDDLVEYDEELDYDEYEEVDYEEGPESGERASVGSWISERFSSLRARFSRKEKVEEHEAESQDEEEASARPARKKRHTTEDVAEAWPEDEYDEEYEDEDEVSEDLLYEEDEEETELTLEDELEGEADVMPASESEPVEPEMQDEGEEWYEEDLEDGEWLYEEDEPEEFASEDEDLFDEKEYDAVLEDDGADLYDYEEDEDELIVAEDTMAQDDEDYVEDDAEDDVVEESAEDLDEEWEDWEYEEDDEGDDRKASSQEPSLMDRIKGFFHRLGGEQEDEGDYLYEDDSYDDYEDEEWYDADDEELEPIEDEDAEEDDYAEEDIDEDEYAIGEFVADAYEEDDESEYLYEESDVPEQPEEPVNPLRPVPPVSYGWDSRAEVRRTYDDAQEAAEYVEEDDELDVYDAEVLDGELEDDEYAYDDEDYDEEDDFEEVYEDSYEESYEEGYEQPNASAERIPSVLADPNELHFDREQDADILPRDATGLDMLSDSYDLMASAAAQAQAIDEPQPIEDPNWGVSSFRPTAHPTLNIARRAALFDIPDPSHASIDPLRDEEEYEEEGFEYEDYEENGLDYDSEAPLDGSGSVSQDTSPSAADYGEWKGGATVRSDLRDADEPLVIDGDDLKDAIVELGDEFLVAHDIWFVATGASRCDHAGIKAFVNEHRRDIRGCFLINLESIGAGELGLYVSEGLHAPRRADRRLVRMLRTIADDLHIKLDTAAMTWDETDAATPMRSRIRAVSIVGLDEGNKPALSQTAADVPDNVDPRQVSSVVRLVSELICRS